MRKPRSSKGSFLAKLLRDVGFKLTVVHGTREPVKLSGGSLCLYEPFECEG